MTKQLIVLGEHGSARASLEDLVASNLNQFKGWHCGAGIENLYIDYDGYVWVGNCASANARFKKVSKHDPALWGFLGNIEKQFKLPDGGVICPYTSCGCGSDISITKYSEKNDDFIKKSFRVSNIPLNEVGKLNNVRQRYPIYKQVLWDLGRRCNYNCSYCWPAVHNTTDPHKSLDLLSSTADKIIDEWSEGHRIRWYFGGGEPTLNPDFEPFVEHLSKRNQWIMLVSNGSQGPSYWSKNAGNYNLLIFSVHFEFMKPNLFLKNYSAVVDKLKLETNRLEKFIIKLMTKPGDVEQSIEFVKFLKDNINYNELPSTIQASLEFDMVPLRDLTDGSKLNSEYTSEDLSKVIQFNSRQNK